MTSVFHASRLAAALFVAFLATALPAAAGIFRPAPRNGVPDVYIVVLNDCVARKSGEAAKDLPDVAHVASTLARAHGGSVQEVWEHALQGFVVRMPEARARRLAEDARVKSVEQSFETSTSIGDCRHGPNEPDGRPLPNYLASTQPLTCPDPDPLNPTQPTCIDNWGLDRIDPTGAGTQTFSFQNNGAPVHAYVLDTGVLAGHREFQFRSLQGVSRVTGGANAMVNPPQAGVNTDDCTGHGTHVAAILGGRTFGVAKDIQIHPVRITGCTPSQGTFLERVVRGLNWIVADVTTNSRRPALVNWSGGNSTDIAASICVRDAVANAIDNSIVVVQAAGNQSGQHDPGTPDALFDACAWSMGGGVPGVITVGGIDFNDGRWARRPEDPDDFEWCLQGDCGSNVGSCIDIWAPAAHINSAIHDPAGNLTCRLGGTSMATPHVSGVVAVYLQSNPNATPAEVERALRSRGIWNALRTDPNAVDYIGRDSDNVLVFSDTRSMGDQAPVASFTYTCTGTTCTFDGMSSSDNGTITYLWRLPDGSTVTTPTFSRTFAAGSTNIVTLRVTDNTGKTDHLRQTVVLGDAPPTASFTYYSCTGLTCTFDSSGSTDNGTITERSWSFGDGTTACGTTVTHAFPVAGTYAVRLTVRDNAAQTGTQTQSVVIGTPNNPPTANYTFTCTGLTCSFNASSSTDSDGTIVAYAWNFGDGTTGSGVTTTHAFPATGTYSVLLTVTDNGGLTGTRTQSVSVVAPNNPPTANFTFSCSALTCTFNGSSSTDDGTITSYAWNFGDGTTGSGVTVTKTYGAVGTYAVTLTVTDNGGLTNARTQNVTVSNTNNPPAANFTYSCAGLTCSFNGSSSTDDGGITSYSWTFGDAASGSGVTTTHTYPAATQVTYAVTLTVSDAYGLQSSKTKKITVSGDALPAALKYFTLRTPCRVLDTRNTTILNNNAPRVIAITGNCGVPSDATAVSVVATAVSPTGSGQIALYPGNLTAAWPGAKHTLTFTPARAPRSNSAVIRLATNGYGTMAINATVSGWPGQTHLLLDIDGYFSPSTTVSTSGPFGFQPVTACRVFDSRNSTPLLNDGVAGMPTIQGFCGVPMGSGAASTHVGVITPQWNGALRVFASDTYVPQTTTVNFNYGIGNLRNGARVRLTQRSAGDFAIMFTSGSPPSASVHATVDVNGYFKSDAPLKYYPITPCRPFDTADPQMGGAALENDSVRTVQIQGNCGVPVGAKAVLVRLVASAPTANGDLTAWPSGQALPAVSTMKFDANEPGLSMGTIIPLSTLTEDLAVVAGQMSPGGTVSVAIEVFGYFQ